MIDIQKELKPGASFKIYYGKNSIDNRVIHIRAIVDDGMVVFRWWNKRGQRWVYAVEARYRFELRNEKGVLRSRHFSQVKEYNE